MFSRTAPGGLRGTEGAGEAPGGCVAAGVEQGLGETSRRAWTQALGSLLLSGPGAWRTLRAGPVSVTTVLVSSAPPPQDKLPCPWSWQ